MRRVWILLVMLLLLSACGAAKPNRENQLPPSFTATIEGTRGETAFGAQLSVSSEERTIRYTAPEAIAGLTVTKTSTGISIRQGDFSAKNQPEAAGFLAPLDLLLSPAELSSIEEQNGEKTLTYADGTKLILQKGGTPRAVIGNDLFYTISDFQTIAK